MRIFNTLTGQKTELSRPVNGKEFRMFICGPTVQDNVHLGHARTYFSFDILARWLLKRGFKVTFLMNITDVDDKIFDRAKRENIPYMDIADKFYQAFIEDLEALNILTVSKFARVSNYIEDSVALVENLVNSGKAYILNGSVFFDTSKAHQFGKLSHQTEYDLKMKIIDAAYGKRNSVDFLLWRRVVGETEGVWECKLGPGRPGWHIEDSAIAFREFEGPYDLHGGANELVFPHHESELAQDEAVSEKVPFVTVWMHTGLLLKDGEKMSKSLGNVITIRDALTKWSGDLLRFYFLKHNYRESFNVDVEAISKCNDEFNLILRAAEKVPKSHGAQSKPAQEISDAEAQFNSLMDDNLDTPRALKILQKVTSEILNGQADDNRADAFWHMIESFGFRLC